VIEPLVNLAQLVHRNAALHPAAEALIRPARSGPGGVERRALTWAELADSVDAMAAGFADPETGSVHAPRRGSGNRPGLVGGQRVALRGPNSLEWVVTYLAVLRAGLVAVPIDPGLDQGSLDEVLAACGVQLVLGTSEHPLTAEVVDDLARHGHAPVASPPDSEALAVLINTAGSTGHPKLVMLSHRALLAQAEHAQSSAVDQGTKLLAAVPFGHVYGLSAVLGGWLGSAARLVVPDLAADRLPEVIAAERVEGLPVTPSTLLRLLRSADSADLHSLRRVVCAGAALPEWLAREFSGAAGVLVEQGYGLTEAAGGVATTAGGPVLGPNHVGRPLPGVEVRIEAADADPGDPGLIKLRGATLFSGYWPAGQGAPDPDGWFVTDDIGYFRGLELFLVDRAREVVLVHGFGVYPAEIEQVISELPQVSGVAVLGVPGRSSGTAEPARIVAFVAAPGLDEAALAQHCRARLPAYKRPAEFTMVTELPRNANGEVRRMLLRDRLLGVRP
jgi:long-chain acyl-CoA synthetase